MKRCPACRRAYADDELKFCRVDGAPLAAEPGEGGATLADPPPGGEAPTELFGAAAPSDELADSSSLTRRLAPGRRRRPARSKVIDSLAILPLANETGEAQAEYLSDGITESIINSLSRLPRLRVVPRATVFRYKGRDADPLAVGRELNARAVVTGRVLLVGGLLVVSAELVDVALESQVWGERYRHQHEDIFTLQERISEEISAHLRPRLSGEDRRRLRQRDTENPAAYDLYLRGRYFMNKRTTEWIRRGVEHFRRAIDLDPGYALAHAGLADAYAFLASSTGEQPPSEFYPKAEAAALKALELDDTLAEAHTSLGFFRLLYEWDFRAAERHFRRAIELQPAYANAHDGHSFYFKATGQHERAVRACREAQKIDPLSLFASVSLAWAYYLARRYDEAVEQNRRALELDPRFFFAHWNLGLALAAQGRLGEAVEALERAVEHSGGGLTFRGHLGYVYGLAGRRREAELILSEFDALSRARYVPAYYTAIIRLGLGEHDRALEALARAFDERTGFLVFLRVEPMFDPLREDPRFTELAARIGAGDG
ncbi:MAG TPA: tetratricopeptide repeat protein [Pyrinomonadaceae bacterium]|nr:tetratricopeptide repeat protein [Pyrinomonadaceae bacterium]